MSDLINRIRMAQVRAAEDAVIADLAEKGLASTPSSVPQEEAMFDEQALYREIVKVWGEHGAHAEVMRYLLERALVAAPPCKTDIPLNAQAYDNCGARIGFGCDCAVDRCSLAASPCAAQPIQAHSKSEYKRLTALGADAVPPAAAHPADIAYKAGHRDARHGAAKLVAAIAQGADEGERNGA